MSIRFPAAILGIAAVLGLAGWSAAQQSPSPGAGETAKDAPKEKDKAKPSEPKTEQATLAGGCFWCLEAVFERIQGVKNVVSGFAGGTVENPSYEMVCTGLTGHAEAVNITYDPEVVSFEDLLEIFWICHDPTTLNRQGPDEGTQYRSAIFYHDEGQREAALRSYKKATAARLYADPIVTQFVPFTKFFAADAHHQNYYRKNARANPYCAMVIAPKLREVQAKLAKRAAAREKAEKKAKAEAEKEKDAAKVAEPK